MTATKYETAVSDRAAWLSPSVRRYSSYSGIGLADAANTATSEHAAPAKSIHDPAGSAATPRDVGLCVRVTGDPRSGGLAAVDDHCVADRERRLVGAQPEHRGGDLLGPAHAADRLLGDDGGAAFVGVAGEAAHHLGVDNSGADGVDADVLGGVVERGGLGQA